MSKKPIKSAKIVKCPSCKLKKPITGFKPCNYGNKGGCVRRDVCSDCAKEFEKKREEKNTKTCVKCGEKKHASQFYLNRPGFQGYCKDCRGKAIAGGENPYPALKRR